MEQQDKFLASRARMLILLTVAATAIHSGTGAAEVPLSSAYGWYEIDSTQSVLLIPSAEGGIFVADIDNFRSGVIRNENGRILWRQSPDEEGRVIEFEANEAGEPISFMWTSESGEARVATRLEAPDYRVEEISFGKNPKLAGTVYVPRGEAAHPAAVFIHGSGESTRDNLWYQAIVHELVMNGVLVLLPDKRGTGKSGGDWTVAALSDYAEDALAAVEALKGLEFVDRERIGLIGISQGGRVAPLAATMSTDVAYVVNVSGAMVTLNEQIVYELGGGIVGRIRAVVAKWRRPEWWKKNGSFDAIPYWKAMEVPGLIVYGEDDDNSPVEQSITLIRDNLTDAANVSSKVFEDTGHGFWDADTKRIREDFLSFLSDWVLQSVDTR